MLCPRACHFRCSILTFISLCRLGILLPLQSFPLLLGYRQTLNAQIVANSRADDVRPTSVDDGAEDEVSPEVVELHIRRHRRETQKWQINHNRSADQWRQQHRPVRKRLARKMRENNLCRDPAKYRRKRQAQQTEMIIPQQRRIRRAQPRHQSSTKYHHGTPFQENWSHG